MALLKVLLLLLGLGVSVNSGVSLQKRIIGGHNCDDTERLYHVRLESSNVTHVTRCGGSLIHPEWILTSTLCWMSEPGWTNTAILKVNPRTAGQQSQVIQDKPVTYTHDDHQHGIILLKLQTPVTDVQPALLPDCRRRLKVGHNVKLAGEGATTTGPNNKQSIPAHLQCVDMKVVAVSLVELPYGHIFRAKAPNKEICYGDTGGAALHSGKIYGVISFGGEGACQSSATIMDVCKYKNWIKKTIKPGK